MEYEKSRKEFYESEIHSMAAQIAEIIDSGEMVEISKSRSGLKLFRIKRRHEVVRKRGNLNE